VADDSWPSAAHNSRAVNDTEYESLVAPYCAEGVIGDPADTSVVYCDSTGTRVVKVRANKSALVRGFYWTSGTSDFSMTSLASNATGSTRQDLIVLRLDRSTWTVRIASKTGTASPPSLTQSFGSTGTYEIPIAQIAVPNGATTLAAGAVTMLAWYAQQPPVGLATTSVALPPVTPSGRRALYLSTNEEWVTNGTSYTRSDWARPWGFVGGNQYPGSASLTTGVGASPTYLNMQSGSYTLISGRSYRVEASVHYTVPGTMGPYFDLRDAASTSGNVIGHWFSGFSMPATTYDQTISGIYNCTSTASKTFGVTGGLGYGSGTFSNSRADGVTGPIPYVGIWDLGPTSTRFPSA